MSFISLFGIIKAVVPEPCIFFWIPASIAEAADVIPKGAKIFFVNGTATFINGPANLLNNDPKNPSDWTILEMWALESFISIDLLLLNALNVLLSVMIHETDYFHQTFLNSVLKLFLFYFWQHFSVFSVEYLFILHFLYFIQFLLFFQKIVGLFFLLLKKCNKSLHLHLPYK